MAIARSPHTLHTVQIQQIREVSPHVRRLTISARSVRGIRKDLPAQWLKVFVPVEGSISRGRAYTVRRFDDQNLTLEIDIVLHGDDGHVCAWAERAMEGDHFQVSDVHPRSGFAIDPSTQDFLLIGDETALPAIGAILEALPPYARAQVHVEVHDAHEEQLLSSPAAVSVNWMHRERAYGVAASSLESFVSTISTLGPTVAVWVAGESAQVAAIRTRLRRECGAAPMYAMSYWKRGEADHRDENI